MENGLPNLEDQLSIEIYEVETPEMLEEMGASASYNSCSSLVQLR